MKIAMVKVDEYLEKNNLEDKVKMIATVHDEIVFRIKKSHIHIIPILAEIMKLENIIKQIKWPVRLRQRLRRQGRKITRSGISR